MRQALHASACVAFLCAARYSLTALLRAAIFAEAAPAPTVAAGVLASLATMRVSLGFFAGAALHAATAASAASGAFRYASRNFASSAMRSLLAAMNASALSPRHSAWASSAFLPASVAIWTASAFCAFSALTAAMASSTEEPSARPSSPSSLGSISVPFVVCVCLAAARVESSLKCGVFVIPTLLSSAGANSFAPRFSSRSTGERFTSILPSHSSRPLAVNSQRVQSEPSSARRISFAQASAVEGLSLSREKCSWSTSTPGHPLAFAATLNASMTAEVDFSSNTIVAPSTVLPSGPVTVSPHGYEP